MKEIIIIRLIFIVAFIGWNCEALRCHLDNGPSPEEVKKVVRTCMSKLDDRKGGGGNKNASDSNDEYYDDDDGGDGESNENSSGNRDRNEKRNNRNRQNSHRLSSRFKRGRQMQPQQPGDEMSPQWRSHLDASSRWNNNNNNNNNQHTNNSNYNNNRKSNDSSGNSTDCLTQCFLQEMKMVTRDGFPDKHKIMHVLTREIRDLELKEFYVDSIQQCFHLLEMSDQPAAMLHDTCQFAQQLTRCLGERARANCEDLQNSMLF